MYNFSIISHSQGNSNQPSRNGEYITLLPFLSLLNQVKLESAVDGGDVLFCLDRVLVGLSLRTSLDGAACLARELRKIDPSIVVDLVSFSGVLFLPYVASVAMLISRSVAFKVWSH
jgi:N-dimethylarginine dimethylaminohydrolase